MLQPLSQRVAEAFIIRRKQICRVTQSMSRLEGSFSYGQAVAVTTAYRNVFIGMTGNAFPSGYPQPGKVSDGAARY